MRTASFAVRLFGANQDIGRIMRVSVGCAAVSVLLAILVAPAAASSPHGPRYSLQISEGETTMPEYDPVAFTSGHVEPSAEVAVSIIRGGVTVYREVETGSAGIPQVPQVGDVVTLESPVGTLIGSVVYDGLPAIDATVCAGSTNFSGENSLGNTVEGFYFAKELVLKPYGQFSLHQTAFGEAQVKSLSGTTFGGSFLKPLALGQTVGAAESLKSSLAGEATYTYKSEFQRPVGACPQPPPPPVIPPPPPVLQGSIFKLLQTSIHALLKSGLRIQVTINQAGSITEDLFARGGTLPAFASAVGKHHRKAAVLLARGLATAKSAGKVTVVLRPTKRGRRKLKDAKRIHAVLITTLRSTSGAKLSLGRRSVTLHR